MQFQYQEQQYQIKRYPISSNKSLKPWSAAEEYALRFLEEQAINKGKITLYNDRFGYWSICLHAQQPICIINQKSQEKALLKNLQHNDCSLPIFCNPLQDLAHTIDTGLIKIPKSLDLFQLYLQQLSQQIHKKSIVIGCFMTKYFSPQMLSIAEQYFETVEQSRAWKKARLLILKQPKVYQERALLHQVPLNATQSFQQYFGVFSAKHIDYASLFFIEHLQVNADDQNVLDLASGNGVLAAAFRSKNSHCDLHLMDDSFLAVASSKLNLASENTFFHYNNNLEHFDSQSFDAVISNPPFHFEHEIDIQIPLGLFKEVERCLKIGGRFQLVANKHLNYKTHLEKIFAQVSITAENQKFIVYTCYK